jgi:iron complex outermembrane receptor protein
VPGTPGGGQDIWNADVWAARGQLAFALSDSAQLLVSGFYAREEVSESPWQSEPALAVFDAQGRVINTLRAGRDETREAVGPGDVGIDIPAIDGDFDGVRPQPGGDLYGYRDPDGPGRLISKDAAFDDSNVYETRGGTARLTWDLGADRTLTAVSHFMRFEKTILNDVDAGPMPLSLYQAVAKTDSFTQELRLDGKTGASRWVAGLYYLDISAETTNGLSFPANSPFASPLIFGAPVEGDNVVSLDTRSYSVFGQVDYALNERWSVVAGARAIREEKQYDWTQNFYLNTDDRTIDTAVLLFPGAATTEGATFAQDTEDTLWSGKLQLEYRPSDGLLVYGGVNRGVKAGSFNAKLPDGTPPLSPDDVGYGEEVLLAYEIGAKSTLADGRLRVNGAVFYYDYSDYQAFVFTQSSGTVTNADASSVGGEIDILATPLPGLDLVVSASYIDATVEGLEVAPGLFRDVRPSYTPKVKLAGLARYEWPFLSGRLSAQIDANYASNFYYNIRNFDAQKIGGYTVGNARLMWRSPDDAWSLTAFVENFADRQYQTGGFDLASLCGCNEVSFGKPRWYGFTARYSF